MNFNLYFKVEKMEEHLGIYDKLDKIKHLIPEQDYIELCDEASSLLRYIETYKNLVEAFRESTDDEEIYTDLEDSEDYDPNMEGRVLDTGITEVGCYCTEKLENIDGSFTFSPVCLSCPNLTGDCVNMRKVVETFPLIENIFQWNNIRPVMIPKNEDREDPDFMKKSRLLLSLIEQFENVREKSIISFAIFDLVFKNFSIIKKHSRLKEVLVRKLEDFSEIPRYREISEEFSIDYTQWRETLINYD